MDPALITNWIQAGASALGLLVTIVLVVVTIHYVRATREIADATQQMAQATIDLAAEAQQERAERIAPIVSVTLRLYPLTPPYPPTLRVDLCNVGLGPALNPHLVASPPLTGLGWRPPTIVPPVVLGVGQSASVEVAFEGTLDLTTVRADELTVHVGYHDAYGRECESIVQCPFRVDERRQVQTSPDLMIYTRQAKPA